MQLFEQAQRPCTQLLRDACDVIWRPLLVNRHGFALTTCHTSLHTHLHSVWLERMRVVYEVVSSGIPVLLSDVDAIWLRDALSEIMAMSIDQPRGYDMIFSSGTFPNETFALFGATGEH